MELLKFLEQPQQHCLKILTWNINGAKTKLGKCAVLSLICQYDIISLNEIKTELCVSLPGYVGYRKTQKNAVHRGGTIVFAKNCLSRYVSSVDLPYMPDYKATGYIRRPPIFEDKLLSLSYYLSLDYRFVFYARNIRRPIDLGALNLAKNLVL